MRGPIDDRGKCPGTYEGAESAFWQFPFRTLSS
jgi:hypothetical protein